MRLNDLPTPSLVLDRGILKRNCAAMIQRAASFGVQLRPHLKTAKCIEVAREATRGQFGGITVSTIAEAAFFAGRGILDLTYAVGIVPSKIEALAALKRNHNASISIILDNPIVAKTVASRAQEVGASFDVLIEIDTGGRRGGLTPNAPGLVELGTLINSLGPALRLEGVLTHAGHSYHARTIEEIQAIAEDERQGAVGSAERLRASGLQCRTVSIGSTPTMVHAKSLEGVTEIRPGVYTFFDIDQMAIGACAAEDIAVSVLASVIGHNRRAGRVLIDAGGLALSKDLSATEFRKDVGYGWVCPVDGSAPIPDVWVADVHQEHGLVASAKEHPPWDSLPLGGRVRILPNHVCMTVAPYNQYYVVDGGDEIVATWSKATGW
jgi:D-serine deaminase-like pyridoxal phosphate-dependent protein